MYIYVLDHDLPNGAMTLAIQGQGHSLPVMKLWKMAFFHQKTPIMFPVSSAPMRLADCGSYYLKAHTQYFITNYGVLIESAA